MELYHQFQFAEPLSNESCYYNAAPIFLMNYYLVKEQYHTTVCMHHHQPNLSVEHVNAMKVDHGNSHAE